jgi:hypothetical protein
MVCSGDRTFTPMDPDMVSLVENRTQLANFTFPKGLLYPRKLLKNNSTKFVKYLGGIEMSEQTFVDETLVPGYYDQVVWIDIIFIPNFQVL